MTIQAERYDDSNFLQSKAVSTTYDTMRKLPEGLRIWTTSEHIKTTFGCIRLEVRVYRLRL